MLMYRGQKETAKEHIDAYFIHLQGWALGNHDCFEAICSPSANTMHLYIGNRGQSLLWSPQSIPPIVLLAHIKIDVRLRTITLQAIDGNVNSSGFWNTYSPIDHLNRCTLFIGTLLIQNYKCQSSLWLFSCTVFVQWEIVVGFHIFSESISKYVCVCVYVYIHIYINYFRSSL